MVEKWLDEMEQRYSEKKSKVFATEWQMVFLLVDF